MAEQTFTIRPLTLNDRALAMRFFDNLGPASLQFFNINDIHRNSLIDWFEGRRPDKRNFVAVGTNAQGEEEIAGYVFLWDVNYKTPWMGICVSDKWHGHGLGKKLTAYVEDYCRKLGKGGIFLTTDKENIAGQKVYTHCGYKQIGYLDDELLYFRFFEDEYPPEDGTV